MSSEIGKKNLFSLDQFIILFAWLGAIFAILYYKAYELVIPSIIAFIILNIAFGIWINKTIKPAQNNRFRKYLIIQTIFLFIWCPLLWLILWSDRMDLIPIWIIILISFYIGIGFVSFKSVFLDHKEKRNKKTTHKKTAHKKKKYKKKTHKKKK